LAQIKNDIPPHKLDKCLKVTLLAAE